ncbi:MAG: MarR family transcriptional regulator [Pseudomonadota bacterium]
MSDTHLAIHLDRLVRRIHASLSARAKTFDTDRVGPGGAILLLTLDEMGTAPLHRLAARLVRDKSQLTREVASLERKGMVRRQDCATDARVSLLSLTAKGAALVKTHQHALAEVLEETLQGMAEADKQKLAALLQSATQDHRAEL